MSAKSYIKKRQQRASDLMSPRKHHHHQIVPDLCYWSAECQDTLPDSFQRDLSVLSDDESTFSDSQQSSAVHVNIKTAISSGVAAMLDSTMTSKDISFLCDDEFAMCNSQQCSTVHDNIKTAISSSVAAMLDSTMISEHNCDNDQTTRPSHKQTSGQAIEMTQSQKRIINKKLKRVGRMMRQGGHDELRTLALL